METISLPLASIIIQVLGLPGLIFIIWHFDNKRLDKQRETYEEQQEKYREQIRLILANYKDDVAAMRRLYDNNVELVKRYEKREAEMVDMIRLNTQAQTQLLDWLKNKPSCYSIIKEKA